MNPSVLRRRRIRTIAVVGMCAAAVASAGIITTFASAATPAGAAGYEGCTGSYIADSGPGTFTLPDVVATGGDGMEGPGVIESELNLDDQELVALTGVVDMHSVSVNCTAVNLTNTKDASFDIRLEASNGGALCAHPQFWVSGTEVNHAEGSKQLNANFDVQCDNPIHLIIHRQISLSGLEPSLP